MYSLQCSGLELDTPFFVGNSVSDFFLKWLPLPLTVDKTSSSFPILFDFPHLYVIKPPGTRTSLHLKESRPLIVIMLLYERAFLKDNRYHLLNLLPVFRPSIFRL